MKRFVLTVVTLFFTFEVASAGNGGFAGAHLRFGLGAKAIAFGNSGVAAPPDGFSFYYNPSKISFVARRYVSFTHYFLSLDRVFNCISLSLPLKPTAGLSLSWIHAGVKDIEGRTYSGLVDEIYNTGEDAFFMSFSNRFFKKLSLGISLKILRNDLVEITGKGIGFDFGLFYNVHTNFKMGVTVCDAGSGYSYNTQKLFPEQGSTYIDEFPTLIKAGFYLKILEKVELVSDIEYSDREEFKIHAGAGYTLSKLARVRIGLNNGSFASGIGLKYDFIGDIDSILDYAMIFGIPGEGVSHVFSWQFTF